MQRVPEWVLQCSGAGSELLSLSRSGKQAAGCGANCGLRGNYAEEGPERVPDERVIPDGGSAVSQKV